MLLPKLQKRIFRTISPITEPSRPASLSDQAHLPTFERQPNESGQEVIENMIFEAEMKKEPVHQSQ
jgi:hypothetical protein